MDNKQKFNKYIEKNRPEQIVFDLVESAEENKRNADNKIDEIYWQGRADMGRIIQALLLNGLTFGLRSGKNSDFLSDEDHDLIDLITLRNLGETK